MKEIKTMLAGVGKKTRYGYLNGNITLEQLEKSYNAFKKESDSTDFWGWTIKDMIEKKRNCKNPIIVARLEKAIKDYHARSITSGQQNNANFKKLARFEKNALGVGLRKVISTMKHAARMTKDFTMKVTALLLETEYSNLCAKNHGKKLKDVIYERKSRLLQQLSDLLYGSDWKYGYNCNCGKNASYLVYIYLPNGDQLTWHSNDFTVAYDFPYIESTWDGCVAATLEKILNFIGEKYNHLFYSNVA